jgi:hypothetical protein
LAALPPQLQGISTMPAQRPGLPPEILQRELRRLLPAVGEGRRRSSRQNKSELAALLFEAHRTNAYRAWGYKNLGTYARDELKMNPATFAKYKSAGRALQQALYERFMAAVRQGQPRPALPDVSELAAMQTLDKQVGRHHDTVDLFRDGASLSKVRTLAKMNAYGDAGPEAQQILSAIDSFTQEIRRGHKLLASLLAETKSIPATELGRRLREVREECRDVIGVLNVIEAQD